MDVCRDETFGPVVAIYRFTDEDEAVARANDTDYGLNACSGPATRPRGRELAARIKAGTVNVNEGYGVGVRPRSARRWAG